MAVYRQCRHAHKSAASNKQMRQWRINLFVCLYFIQVGKQKTSISYMSLPVIKFRVECMRVREKGKDRCKEMDLCTGIKIDRPLAHTRAGTLAHGGPIGIARLFCLLLFVGWVTCRERAKHWGFSSSTTTTISYKPIMFSRIGESWKSTFVQLSQHVLHQ